jgi:phosphoglycolate phosphatase-like HAD superfamily hydrolase
MSRLILFDIDETMIHSSGAGRKALEKAMLKVFGREISLDGHSLSGKTDPQIIREVLHAHGFTDEQIKESSQQIFEAYIPFLDQEVVNASEYKLHEGVVDLLDVLQKRDDAYIGLLTGNIEVGARIKLKRFDLNRYFEFGAFGCDSPDRMELPAFAHGRATSRFSRQFDNKQIVIIGDARNDVLCAKGYGARSVAVCTGKTSRETLVELEPDYIFDSLKDTAQVLDAIFAE